MDATVSESEWVAYQFPYLLTLLGGEEEVERVARETGAFVRSREIKSAGDLLQLLMIWAVADCSTRETAALSAEAGLADVSNVALLKRFKHCREFAGRLLGRALGERRTGDRHKYRIRLIDGTVLTVPGSKGTDYRAHVSIQLPAGAIDEVEVTDARGGETLKRFRYDANDLVIADRGYAHRAGLQSIVEQNAFFIVRLPYQNIPLQTPSGEKLDVLRSLRALGEAVAGELEVCVELPNGTRLPCRLIAARKTEVSAQQARDKMIAEAKKKGRNTSLGALEMAAFVCVLTNLPPTVSGADVLDLYSIRWQIEMKFKTLKSVIRLGDIPSKDADRAQVYILIKLLAAVLIDQLSERYESFPPWGYRITSATTQQLAPHQVSDASPASRHPAPLDIRSIVD